MRSALLLTAGLLLVACHQPADPVPESASQSAPQAAHVPAPPRTAPLEPLPHASAPAAKLALVVSGEPWESAGAASCVVNADSPSGFQQWQFEITGPKPGQFLRVGFDVPSEPGERPMLSAMFRDPPQQAIELAAGTVQIERFEPTSAGARVSGRFELRFADSALTLRDGRFEHLDCQ